MSGGNDIVKAETRQFMAGKRGWRAEGERQRSGVPRIRDGQRRPYSTAFGVNLRNSSPAGFTLVELLTTLVIIAILAGLVVAVGKYALTKAGTSRAQAEIAAMENALERYKSDNGRYPASTVTRNSPSPPGVPTIIEIYNSTNLYSALSGKYFTFKPNQLAGTGAGTYVVDPFGHPYNYYCPPVGTVAVWSNQATFDLWSYGPSGTNGDPNMITNWKQ